MERFTTKQEVPQELVATEPGIVEYIGEKMRTEAGKTIMDILSKGGEYIFSVKPRIEDNDTFKTVSYRNDILYKPLVRCKDCMRRMSPNRDKFCMGRYDDFYCAEGIRQF